MLRDKNKNRPLAREVRSLVTDDGLRHFTSRCNALFGHADTSALQIAFERGHAAIEDWRTGRKIPRDVHVILELLEHTNPRSWPKRWRSLIISGHRKGVVE